MTSGAAAGARDVTTAARHGTHGRCGNGRRLCACAHCRRWKARMRSGPPLPPRPQWRGSAGRLCRGRFPHRAAAGKGRRGWCLPGGARQCHGTAEQPLVSLRRRSVGRSRLVQRGFAMSGVEGPVRTFTAVLSRLLHRTVRREKP